MRSGGAAIAFAVAIAAASPAPAAAQGAEQTLDRATAAYAQMRTAKILFTQTLNNPLTNKDVTSKGELLEKLPGHYLVTFTDPKGDRIVSDGKVVWVYLPSTNPGQVIKMPVGDGGTRVPDFTAWLLDRPKERFALKDLGAATVNGRATHVLLLAPKVGGIPFTSAKLWIGDADGIVRQFETVDANGSVRRVRVDAIEMNVPVNASAFTFTVPAGVKVYEPGGSGA